MSWLGLAAVILALAVLVGMMRWAAKSVDPFDWDDDEQDTKGALSHGRDTLIRVRIIA